LKARRNRVDTVLNRKLHGDDVMARASTGRATPAKAKAAPPAAARKKTKAAVAAPKKKAVAKKVAAVVAKKKAVAVVAKKKAVAVVVKKKVGAPKMTPALRKGVSGKAAAKKVAAGRAKGKAPALKKAAAVVKKAAPAKKATSPVRAKTVAVKKIAARRPIARAAVPTPAPRRARAAAVPRKVAASAPPAKAASSAKPPQVFTVSHLNQGDFKADGLRTYAQYRDLGIAAATGGLCQAHVIRFTPPCTDEVRKRHSHQADLQLIYVLQGWMKNEFEGQGEQMMSAGSCWLQPSGIKHTVLDYSADCEVLEIIVPADFKTDELV
jgi:uncharacterized RmlC-like cupin family protein